MKGVNQILFSLFACSFILAWLKENKEHFSAFRNSSPICFRLYLITETTPKVYGLDWGNNKLQLIRFISSSDMSKYPHIKEYSQTQFPLYLHLGSYYLKLLISQSKFSEPKKIFTLRYMKWTATSRVDYIFKNSL